MGLGMIMGGGMGSMPGAGDGGARTVIKIGTP
jgi:hypothetical protein